VTIPSYGPSPIADAFRKMVDDIEDEMGMIRKPRLTWREVLKNNAPDLGQDHKCSTETYDPKDHYDGRLTLSWQSFKDSEYKRGLSFNLKDSLTDWAKSVRLLSGSLFNILNKCPEQSQIQDTFEISYNGDVKAFGTYKPYTPRTFTWADFAGLFPYWNISPVRKTPEEIAEEKREAEWEALTPEEKQRAMSVDVTKSLAMRRY